MLTAKEIMRTKVLSVGPEMSLEALGKFFISNDISGAPVINSEGKLVGIVTEYDLISTSQKVHIPSVLRLFDAAIPLELFGSMQKEIKKVAASQVSDIYTKEVVSIAPDATIEDIATIMSEKHLTLLPVISNNEIVGVVGKHEVIRGVAGETANQ